jgi:hypothetical protein
VNEVWQPKPSVRVIRTKNGYVVYPQQFDEEKKRYRNKPIEAATLCGWDRNKMITAVLAGLGEDLEPALPEAETQA